MDVAKDAEEALRILDENSGSFNLLFSDYNMPGMNGLELISHALEMDPKLKCVLTSGYLTDHDRKQADALERTKVLGKPYQIDEALKDIYRRLRPGDPPTVANARGLLRRLFFDPKKYDLGRVGRYKINQKLGINVDPTERIRKEIADAPLSFTNFRD